VETLITALQLVCLGERDRICLLLERLSILLLKLVRASEFAFRFFNFDLSTDVSWLQLWMAGPTSSSYFRHFPNTFVHSFKAFAKSLDPFDKSHFLMVSDAVSIALSSQQVQASDPDFLMHAVLLALKTLIASLHSSTSVLFGAGRFLGLQASFISVSHFSNVSVKLVS
jgi:hypothetical protein